MSSSTLDRSATSDLLLNIRREVDIAAPAAQVFASILEIAGPGMKNQDGSSMNMRIEPFPGGRMYRDMGNNTGHLWGHVQVIKPPLLLEICGPMMMSYAAVSHVQYRVTQQGEGCKLTVTHQAIGNISPQHREGLNEGWQGIIDRIAAHATAG